MGLRLAREPELLEAMRHKLLGNRLTAPLFDIAHYTRDFEAALTWMWEIWANGQEPTGFAVPTSLPRTAPVPSTPPIKRIAYLVGPVIDSAAIL
jgi:hypothetical protein